MTEALQAGVEQRILREFLAEADKAKLEINPVPAQRIEDLLRELYAIPADITKKAAVLFN